LSEFLSDHPLLSLVVLHLLGKLTSVLIINLIITTDEASLDSLLVEFFKVILLSLFINSHHIDGVFGQSWIHCVLGLWLDESNSNIDVRISLN